MSVESVTAFRCSDGSIYPTIMIAEEHEKAIQQAVLIEEAGFHLENDLEISRCSGEEIVTSLLEKYILIKKD